MGRGEREGDRGERGERRGGEEGRRGEGRGERGVLFAVTYFFFLDRCRVHADQLHSSCTCIGPRGILRCM